MNVYSKICLFKWHETLEELINDALDKGIINASEAKLYFAKKMPHNYEALTNLIIFVEHCLANYKLLANIVYAAEREGGKLYHCINGNSVLIPFGSTKKVRIVTAHIQ